MDHLKIKVVNKDEGGNPEDTNGLLPDSTQWAGIPENIKQLYEMAQEDTGLFWEAQAKRLLSCASPWINVLEGDFSSREIKWFSGARLNASYNCLDRHLKSGKGDKKALIWQGEDEEHVEVLTYRQLHEEVCKFANVLKSKGVEPGDCVSLYLPMIPELVVAVLACARIGAVHSVVFSGFSSVSLQSRIRDCRSKVVVTADAVNRAGRALPLKANADEALAECSCTESCIVVRRSSRDVKMTPFRDSWYHEEMARPEIHAVCEPEEIEANDTLFVLYTSGATGKPKGVAHRTAGYLLYAMYTCELVFGPREEDIFWCTADIGWITGHTYSIYGPLGLGGTTLIYEGIPLYPGPDRYWKIIEKFNVTIFYTAPTVIRALMRFGAGPVNQRDLSSLRVLGSVGEPINREAWDWYNNQIGKDRLRIADTWWQTETAGVMICPLQKCSSAKAGSASLPLPGIDAFVVNEAGEEVGVEENGRLVVRHPWPGLFKEILGEKDNRQVFMLTADNSTVYDSGDGARRDKNGDFWIVGRLDDVINVSGHRLGTAEIESALLTHPSVAEAAVVGCPHSLKGQAVYAYVTLNRYIGQTAGLIDELREHVREKIGPIASPESIQYAQVLPKTRSGKIMRRVLKKIAADDFNSFGDTSSLADPSILSDLIEGKRNNSVA